MSSAPLPDFITLPYKIYFVRKPITLSTLHGELQHNRSTLRGNVAIGPRSEWVPLQELIKHHQDCLPDAQEGWRWEFYLAATRLSYHRLDADVTELSWPIIRRLLFDESLAEAKEHLMLKAIAFEPDDPNPEEGGEGEDEVVAGEGEVEGGEGGVEGEEREGELEEGEEDEEGEEEEGQDENAKKAECEEQIDPPTPKGYQETLTSARRSVADSAMAKAWFWKR